MHISVEALLLLFIMLEHIFSQLKKQIALITQKHIFLRRIVETITATPLYIPAGIVFSLLFFPFVGLIPYLDGDTEFQIAVNFYAGKYLSNWMPYHPPLKLALTDLLFHLFGFFSYSVLGYILGVIGIIALYAVANTLFDKKTAILASLLFSLSGVYLSSAVFSLNDFILTVFILLSFIFYVKEKYVFAALMGMFAVLSKESAIIFPITICIVEICQKKLRAINLLPFVALGAWILFLHVTGHTLWNSWNFSDSRQSGSLWTVIDNIFHGKIFNKFAYENWLHVFIFNYNWVLWLFVIFALFHIVWNRYFSIIFIFIVLYCLTILSFQTYSITRYILPIMPFVYLFVAVTLRSIPYKVIMIPLIFTIVIVSLWTSADPVSNLIWKKWQILHQSFYINREIDGTDGITYNMQFLSLAKERTNLIMKGKCSLYTPSLEVHEDTLETLRIQYCK